MISLKLLCVSLDHLIKSIWRKMMNKRSIIQEEKYFWISFCHSIDWDNLSFVFGGRAQHFLVHYCSLWGWRTLFPGDNLGRRPRNQRKFRHLTIWGKNVFMYFQRKHYGTDCWVAALGLVLLIFLRHFLPFPLSFFLPFCPTSSF